MRSNNCCDGVTKPVVAQPRCNKSEVFCKKLKSYLRIILTAGGRMNGDVVGNDAGIEAGNDAGNEAGNEKGLVEPLPDLDTLTIAKLKELGAERGYNDIWRRGTKRADYIKWIQEQYNEEVRKARPDPLTIMMADMRANMERVREQKAKAAGMLDELMAKKKAVETKIAALESVPEKTPAQYESIIVLLKSLIKLNDIITTTRRLV